MIPTPAEVEAMAKRHDECKAMKLLGLKIDGGWETYYLDETQQDPLSAETAAMLRSLAAQTAANRYKFTEDNCPNHISDPKVCVNCGVHIDSFRPPEENEQ